MIPVYSKFVDCYLFHRGKDAFQYLLLLRNNHQLYPNTWQSIQGKIKASETAVEAAKREILEETGLSPIALWNLDFQNTYYYPKTNEMYIFPVFVGEVDRLDVKISSEHTDYKWVDIEDATNSVIWRCQKESFERIHHDFYMKPNKEKLEFTRV